MSAAIGPGAAEYLSPVILVSSAHLLFPRATTITYQLSLDAYCTPPSPTTAMNSPSTTSTMSTTAPLKVHFSAPSHTQSAERRQLRSPPPKPKGKFFTRPSQIQAQPKARAIRRLGDGRRVDMESWVPIPDFRPYDYTLLALGEAQSRDEIVHRMFPTRV
ncbi:hypothetical protein C8Q73DRAFT_795537 [Cubamyces lactineus]|nr:hypothetical protein C8Q73DRAFT_795537 [Cubamyces lactineus]